MSRLDLPAWNSEVGVLVAPERTNVLGPGSADKSQFSRLQKLSAQGLVAPHSLVDRTMATACLAGLWLHWDFLDESHSLSQDLATIEGSYWHGIMHRREPDYGNAKYWFHRVGEHPIYEPLARQASALASSTGDDPRTRFLRTQDGWDADQFVDLCQAASRGTAAIRSLCESIQQAEWMLLFTHCYRAAAGQ